MTPTAPDLTINGKDALAEWGIVAGTKLLATLLTPAAVKDPVQSRSRLEDGTRTVIPEGSVKLAARELTLEVGMRAASVEEFLARFDSFTTELASGWLAIASPRYLPGRVFRCRYVSCTQFTNYNGRLGKFILKIEEPNPADRT